MRSLLIGLAVWTAVSAAIVLFWPGSVPRGGCWRLIEPPPGCLDQLAELNRELWWTNTAPMLAVIGGGYVLIAILALGRHRRSAREARDAQR